MSLAEWQAAQPVRPVMSMNGRSILNADEVRDYEQRQTAEQWAREENQRRHGLAMAASIPANRVPEVAPDDWPGWTETPTSQTYEEQRREARRSGRERAIADAMGLTVADLASIEGQDVVTTESGQTYDATPGTSRARWADAHPDLPNHRPDRPSQQPVGRHERYVRAQAKRKGISPEAADAEVTSHPEGCPWQSAETREVA